MSDSRPALSARRAARVSRLAWATTLVLLACALAPQPLAAQERPELLIPRLTRPPVLEDFDASSGALIAPHEFAHVSQFIQRTPVDGEAASQRTDVYLGYDDAHFYAVFVAHDSQPNEIRANLNRRDQISSDDVVEVMLDTYHDQRRAYAFVANPLGVQWDALWTEGDDFDESWDTLWYSQGKLTDYGYIVLMSIPFRSLRFPPINEQAWGMLLLREVQRNNEQAFWPYVSTRIEGRLNQAAVIRGLNGISPGRNVQLIPYVTSRTFRLLDTNASPHAGFVEDDFDEDGGVDAKFILNDNLAVDATLNPDFSQVESDNPQVTVNQRFEVFFPEKRPFFLENAGFFQTRTNLLFTRRIADPQFGGRATGKVGPYTVGALLIDDQAPGKSVSDDDPLDGKRAFVGALRVNRDISAQSTVGFIVTDRELDDAYNRVAAVDGRLRITDTWEARGQAGTSWTRELDGATHAGPLYSAELNRSGRHVNNHLHYFDVGTGFDTDVGFVTRRDIRDLHQSLGYTFRPEGDVLIAWGPSFFWQTIWDHSGTRLDWTIQSEVDCELTRQTELELLGRIRGERLRPEDFAALTENVDFTPWEIEFQVDSKFTNLINAELTLAGGRAVNFVPPSGELPELEDELGIEFDLVVRPTSAFNISHDYLYTRLQDRESGDPIFEDQILRSRWNWQFNRRLSMRAIFQYEWLNANSSLSRLEKERNFNTDILLVYQVNAWTALYAGFNSNFINADLMNTPSGPTVVPTGSDLHNDSRQFFVKLSYMLRI